MRLPRYALVLTAAATMLASAVRFALDRLDRLIDAFMLTFPAAPMRFAGEPALALETGTFHPVALSMQRSIEHDRQTPKRGSRRHC